MKIKIMSLVGLCALVLGLGPAYSSPNTAPEPGTSSASPALFAAGGYLLQQQSLSDPSEWELTGFLMVGTNDYQTGMLHVLATKADPTELERVSRPGQFGRIRLQWDDSLRTCRWRWQHGRGLEHAPPSQRSERRRGQSQHLRSPGQ